MILWLIYKTVLAEPWIYTNFRKQAGQSVEISSSYLLDLDQRFPTWGARAFSRECTGKGLEINFEHLKLCILLFTLLVHSDYSTRLIVYYCFCEY